MGLPVRAAEVRWEVCALPDHHVGAGVSAWEENGLEGSVPWCVCTCVWGGSSEATQSLVLRHCIPAGRLPVPDAFLPQSHRGDCLGIWPHIL